MFVVPSVTTSKNSSSNGAHVPLRRQVSFQTCEDTQMSAIDMAKTTTKRALGGDDDIEMDKPAASTKRVRSGPVGS